jgi:signal transduction histidine kinase
MTDPDAGWVELAGRLADCPALLLDEQGRIVAADARALDLLGAEAVAQLHDRWNADEALKLCRDERASSPLGARGELEGTSDGTPRLSARVLRIGGDGRSIALVGKLGSKQVEDRYVAFARQLGHDLRGPLNSMVLNLDLLKTSLSAEEVDEQLAAKRTRYLGAIVREIERLNQTLTTAVTAAKETG